MEGHAIAACRREASPAGENIVSKFFGKAAAFVLAAVLLATGASAQSDPTNAAGQQYVPTTLRPADGSRLIFVSSSLGNDNNDGRSPSRPVKTIEHGLSLIRNYSADWLLLRRGDVFMGGVHWNKNGRSPSEPVVLLGWGQNPQRPIVYAGQHDHDYGFNISALKRVNVSVVGIHFLAPPQGTTVDGIRLINDNGSDILFEDCIVQGFRNGINIRDGYRVTIRGCIIIDNAAVFGGHGQGLYCDGTEDLLVEYNVFDRNGWRPGVLERKMFNHNIYLRGTNEIRQGKQRRLVRPVVRYNICSNGSSWGITASSDVPGGVIRPVIEHNLLFKNANGFVHGASVRNAIFESRVRHNVIASCGAVVGDRPQAFGILIEGTWNSEVSQNLLMDVQIDNGTRIPLNFVEPSDPNKGNGQLVARKNKVYRWPQRNDGFVLSVAEYEIVHQINNLVSEARIHGARRHELTAPAINSWLRRTQM